MISVKEFNTVAQLSHAGWGLAIVFGPMALVHSWKVTLIVAGVWIAYTLVKEFWYDYHYETPEVRGSSLLDAGVQIGASLVALALCYFVK